VVSKSCVRSEPEYYGRYVRHIPLFLTTQASDGKASLDRESIFSERETSIKMDASKPYLVKGGNRGVCESNTMCNIVAFLSR